jgi:hypothetical protein
MKFTRTYVKKCCELQGGLFSIYILMFMTCSVVSKQRSTLVIVITPEYVIVGNNNRWNDNAAAQCCLLRQSGNVCINSGSGQKGNFKIKQYKIL